MWLEFAAADKASITPRALLSHKGGLVWWPDYARTMSLDEPETFSRYAEITAERRQRDAQADPAAAAPAFPGKLPVGLRGWHPANVGPPSGTRNRHESGPERGAVQHPPVRLLEAGRTRAARVTRGTAPTTSASSAKRESTSRRVEWNPGPLASARRRGDRLQLASPLWRSIGSVQLAVHDAHAAQRLKRGHRQDGPVDEPQHVREQPPWQR